MREFILNCTATEIMIAGLLFFAVTYLSFVALSFLLTRKLLPAHHIGMPLDTRPLAPGQLRRELEGSAMSVMIFGLGLVFPWGLLKLGWARLAVDLSLLQTLCEMLVLVVWNEIHFYINHRLLHTRWLRKFHVPHHRSVVTTPWSAYNFHPVEALMLGSVLMLPMMLHDFSVYALAFVPLFSLLINSLGHANYDVNPASSFFLLQGVRRHQLHHARFNGNYGFMLPFMDRLCHTLLPEEEEEAQLS
jgi:Delta7-sterol 5-desaturase